MIATIKKHLFNIPGKRIAEKIIVFESDDWGSIRMPDTESVNYFLAKGWVKENDAFSRVDALESEKDLTALIEVLTAFRDSTNNHPVITANTIVCNPDFKAIETSDFQVYKSELFTETYKRYPEHQRSLEFFKKGIALNVLFPQFHGREHVNVEMWMDLLRSGDERFRDAFKRKCFAIDYKTAGNRRDNLMAAYDYHSLVGFNAVAESIVEGLNHFERIFGIKSATVIPPCYVWDAKVENVFSSAGVKGIQSSKFQNAPNGESFKRKFHFNGERNALGQHYTIRNALFEPALNTQIDWVEKCIESIGIAFTWGKPAIVGTHRLNYCGYLNQDNRDRNLALLAKLFERILKRWPDAKFVNSAHLASIYQST